MVERRPLVKRNLDGFEDDTEPLHHHHPSGDSDHEAGVESHPDDAQTSPPSSSEDESFGQRAILPVAKFDSGFTVDSVPSSGEQYLAIVKHQRDTRFSPVQANEGYVLQPRSLDQISMSDVDGAILEEGRVPVPKAPSTDIFLEEFQSQEGIVQGPPRRCFP